MHPRYRKILMLICYLWLVPLVLEAADAPKELPEIKPQQVNDHVYAMLGKSGKSGVGCSYWRCAALRKPDPFTAAGYGSAPGAPSL